MVLIMRHKLKDVVSFSMAADADSQPAAPIKCDLFDVAPKQLLHHCHLNNGHLAVLHCGVSC